MGPFILLLIFSVLMQYCKKEEIKDLEVMPKKEILGIYELYPSYEKIYIKFEEEEKCQILYKDTIENCIYKIWEQKLLIYTDTFPIGIFFIDNQTFIKGTWREETRFLKVLKSFE
ncbi:MAG: hypothetical protein ACK4UJ_10545 [Leptonema sp. (in: bacteria)]